MAGAVIPGDDPVVQAKDDIGDRQIIEPRPRQPFEAGAVVVPDVSGCSPWNGGRSLERLCAEPGQELANHQQGVLGRGACGRRTLAVDARSAVLGDHDDRWIGHEKREVTEPIGIPCAVQEQRIREVANAFEGVERVRDGGELLDHGT